MLSTALKNQVLEAYAEFILSKARPVVELIAHPTGAGNSLSQAGGSPALPPDFIWPTHPDGTYRFIAQIDLSELADLAKLPPLTEGFPKTGLLSFFYVHDQNGQVYWRDPAYLRVFHFQDPGALQITAPPAHVQLGGHFPLRFQAGLDIPPWPQTDSERQAWEIPDSHRDAYWDLRLQLHPGLGHLLGYSFNTTLGYNSKISSFS